MKSNDLWPHQLGKSEKIACVSNTSDHMWNPSKPDLWYPMTNDILELQPKNGISARLSPHSNLWGSLLSPLSPLTRSTALLKTHGRGLFCFLSNLKALTWFGGLENIGKMDAFGKSQTTSNKRSPSLFTAWGCGWKLQKWKITTLLATQKCTM